MFSSCDKPNLVIGSKEDNPDTSKAHIMGQGRRWIESVGGVVEDEGDEAGVEVSPLISYVSNVTPGCDTPY